MINKIKLFLKYYTYFFVLLLMIQFSILYFVNDEWSPFDWTGVDIPGYFLAVSLVSLFATIAITISINIDAYP